MSDISHPSDIRNQFCNVVAARMDEGGSGAPGKIELYDVSNILLATFIMSFPAYQAPVNGLMQANAIGSAIVAATGEAVTCQFKSGLDNLAFSGSVSDLAGTGDVRLNRPWQPGTQLNAGDTIDAVPIPYNASP